MMTEKTVRARQFPLMEQYKKTPEDAKIIDKAKSTGGTDTDPFHGQVIPGTHFMGVAMPFGIHRAVGGYHDLPNPGDLLCAALAACFDSTLRIIAEHLGVTITALNVDVSAHLDVRGTLQVDKSVPVGFQSIQCQVDLKTDEDTDPAMIPKLIAATEQCCVVFQTLKNGVSIETSVNET